LTIFLSDVAASRVLAGRCRYKQQTKQACHDPVACPE
jgi:hypothetical protein